MSSSPSRSWLPDSVVVVIPTSKDTTQSESSFFKFRLLVIRVSPSFLTPKVQKSVVRAVSRSFLFIAYSCRDLAFCSHALGSQRYSRLTKEGNDWPSGQTESQERRPTVRDR